MSADYKTEFPDFILDLNIPATWEDTSYRNDASPSWMFQNKQIYIDYADKALREIQLQEWPRFCVMLLDDEGQLTQDDAALTTDDFDEVLKFVGQ